MKRDLHLMYKRYSKKMLKACNQNQDLAEGSIIFKEPIYGSATPLFRDFVAPGMIIIIVYFLAVSLTAASLIAERTEGLLDRSWVAGVYPGEVMFAHGIIQVVIVCGQTAIVIIFMIYVFNVECYGSIILLSILSVLQGVSGMCNGFFISAICDREHTATQLSLGIFYPNMVLSGIIWPLEGMHKWLQYIAVMLPLTLPTTALRAIMSKSFGIDKYDVYMGFIVSISWILIYILSAYIAFKFKNH